MENFKFQNPKLKQRISVPAGGEYIRLCLRQSGRAGDGAGAHAGRGTNRIESRRREQMKRTVQRLAARGRSLLLPQGHREKKGWWLTRRWAELCGQFGKVADPAGFDDADGLVGRLEGAHHGLFVTASGFPNDLRGGLVPQPRQELGMALGIVGQGVRLAGQIQLQSRLGTIQADLEEGHSEFAPSQA